MEKNNNTDESRLETLSEMMKKFTSHFPQIEVIGSKDMQKVMKEKGKIWKAHHREA